MDEERWAHCRDTDAYDISTNGRIKNNKTGKELKTYKDERGREKVSIRVNKTKKTKLVHKLVNDAFEEDGGKRNRKILVVETGKVYNTIRECSEDIGVNPSTVCKCLNYPFYGNRKGLHFKYTD